MATGLPSKTQVIELLDGEFARVGYEIEDVVIDTRARPPRITIVADSDAALDLNTAADLSRRASALLDERDVADDRYVLDVSSPGVERPLTSARHFRRARGRKVELTLTDGTRLTGRIGQMRDDALSLVIRSGRDWSVCEVPIARVTEAVVQVEFSPPARRELELAEQPAQSLDTEAGA